MEKSLASLLITVLVNASVFVVAVVLFAVYRKLRANTLASAPLLGGPPFSEGQVSHFQALKTLYTTSEGDISNLCKVDGYLYLSLLKNIGYFLALASSLGLSVLVPIYNSSSGNEALKQGKFMSFSISNLAQNDNKTVLAALLCLFFAVLVLFLGYNYYKQAYTGFLQHLPPNSAQHMRISAQLCTVIVRDLPKKIPAHIFSSIFKQQFEERFPNSIHSAVVVPDLTGLLQLCKKQREVCKQLEKYKLLFRENFKRPKVRLSWFKPKVDAILHYEIKLQELEDHISFETEKIPQKNLGVGFVVCKSPALCESLKNSFKPTEDLDIKLLRWKVSSAPYCSDIVWENLGVKKLYSSLKVWAINILFSLVFLLILTPLTTAGLLSEFLEEIKLISSIRSAITFSLPSIVLSLFGTTLVPVAISVLVRQEPHSSYSSLQASIITKFLIFLVGVLIIFPLLGAFTLSMVVSILSKVEILEWNIYLSKNIVSVGEFYISFVISMAFIANLLDLLDIGSYLTQVFEHWRAVTPQEEEAALEARPFNFAFEYSKVLILFCIILMFSVSTPLILPFGTIYIGIKYWVDKYNLLFVCKVEPTTFGKLQQTVLVFIVLEAGLFMLVNSGVFMLSGAAFWTGLSILVLGVWTLLAGFFINSKGWDFLESSVYSSIQKDWESDSEFIEQAWKLYQHPCQHMLSFLKC